MRLQQQILSDTTSTLNVFNRRTRSFDSTINTASRAQRTEYTYLNKVGT